MCGCNSSAPAVQQQPRVQAVVYVANPSCTFTEIDVYNVRLRLQCLQNKVKPSVYNKYMGVVNSLINLGDYCRYDLEPIIAVLDQNGC